MLRDVAAIESLDGHRLRLHFEDSVEGVVYVQSLVRFTGVFAPLQDAVYFAKVRVNPETGTVCWPNGADLDPDVLYAEVSGEPIDLTEPLGLLAK